MPLNPNNQPKQICPCLFESCVDIITKRKIGIKENLIYILYKLK